MSLIYILFEYQGINRQIYLRLFDYSKSFVTKDLCDSSSNIVLSTGVRNQEEMNELYPKLNSLFDSTCRPNIVWINVPKGVKVTENIKNTTNSVIRIAISGINYKFGNILIPTLKRQQEETYLVSVSPRDFHPTFLEDLWEDYVHGKMKPLIIDSGDDIKTSILHEEDPRNTLSIVCRTSELNIDTNSEESFLGCCKSRKSFVSWFRKNLS